MRLASLTYPIYLLERIDYNLDALVREVEANIDWSGGTGEEWVAEYVRDRRLDPEDYESRLATNALMANPDFDAWIRETVESKAQNIEWEIGQKIKDGHIVGTRAITVPDPMAWVQGMLAGTGRNLGEYWAHDPNSAEAHWGTFGNNHKVMIITGLIPADRIEWNRTLAVNMTSEDEKEIYVSPGTPIQILNVSAQTENTGWRKAQTDLDIGQLRGMSFPA